MNKKMDRLTLQALAAVGIAVTGLFRLLLGNIGAWRYFLMLAACLALQSVLVLGIRRFAYSQNERAKRDKENEIERRDERNTRIEEKSRSASYGVFFGAVGGVATLWILFPGIEKLVFPIFLGLVLLGGMLPQVAKKYYQNQM